MFDTIKKLLGIAPKDDKKLNPLAKTAIRDLKGDRAWAERSPELRRVEKVVNHLKHVKPTDYETREIGGGVTVTEYVGKPIS